MQAQSKNVYVMEPYDNSLKEILSQGKRSFNERTQKETLRLFSLQNRYDVSEYFPLITKRRIWPKAIWHELLWYLQGSSNVNTLEKMGSKIWNLWRSKEFENKHFFVDGSLGPVYGFQFRHFGGFFGNGNEKNHTYGLQGVDQLEYICKLIRTDPLSRHIFSSVWNPIQLPKMRLAPCHVDIQVYIDQEDREISLHLYQRSADYPVGVPANIQFYTTFLYMLGKVFDYRPKELVHTTGDSHIYVEQIPAVEEYLSREFIYSPTVKLKEKEWAENLSDVDRILSYTCEDFLLENYQPNGPIKIPVAV